jgi:ABC-type bacteriocin/lantibiotic exporter with double-glycine peptidase domain
VGSVQRIKNKIKIQTEQLNKIVRDIFKIIDGREKKKFAKLVLFDVVISLLDISFLALLLFVIHFYTTPRHSISLRYFPLLDNYPLLLIVVFFILFSAKNFFGFIVFRMQLHFVYDVASRLSQKKLSNYLDGNYYDYVNIDSSVHIRNISQQPIEFGHYVLGGLQQIISQSVLILLTIIVILIFNPVLFPLLFAILTPPILLTGILMKKKLTTVRKMAKPVSEKTLQHLKEALSAYIESNLYGRKYFFSNRYHASQSKFNAFLSEQLSIQNMPSRLIEVFAIFGLVVLILINSFTANNNSLELITLGAFMAAAYKIIPGIVKILNSNGQIKTYEFTIGNLLQTEEEAIPEKGLTNNKLNSVEFRKISFSYKNELVLDKFCLQMMQGAFIGLSGKSGKGKTTIINLLLGFLESNNGSIYFNNIVTNAAERQQYWKNISYVKQQQLMIYDSIVNNITLTENVYDTERLESAIKAAGLGELIDKCPEGMNTIISEEGKNISGGQRQRISIARALYKDADLIILDEPFNELDRNSEDLLLEHFIKLSKQGKIILLITHNKESLSYCNKIIYLDEA